MKSCCTAFTRGEYVTRSMAQHPTGTRENDVIGELRCFRRARQHAGLDDGAGKRQAFWRACAQGVGSRSRARRHRVYLYTAHKTGRSGSDGRLRETVAPAADTPLLHSAMREHLLAPESGGTQRCSGHVRVQPDRPRD